ncbi:ATP-binding protein [bacterium]|nr:ATP-binding protein [bacterium]
MARTIAVASGKGGTGKTTVVACLAAVSSEPLAVLDCDVEEPNLHLFLNADWQPGQPVTVPVPVVDETRCNYCGNCRLACRFNAIAVLPTGPMLFPGLCHGCGGCILACPYDALSEVPRPIGSMRTGRWREHVVLDGRLEIGEAKSPPLIEAVRQAAPDDRPVLIDAPPGTSCPLVSAVRGVDYVVLVTEPTPLGRHDLALAAAAARQLGLPTGVVINRAGSNDELITSFCAEQGLPVLARIPFDRRIAAAYAQGQLPVEAVPELRPLFAALAGRLLIPAAKPAGASREQA